MKARQCVVMSLWLVSMSAVCAGEITPYQAKTIQPYQAKAIQPYQAKQVQPVRAQPVQQYQARPVQQQGSREIEMYQSKEAHRYTKEEFAAMNQRTAEEAKRIAKQRNGNVDPTVSTNQQYWQQQILHRQTEAYNPDVTYRGR